ncbi:RNA-directed DNA polymerase, eukaryota, reverse transcriptase zinc-binding domain protein [Tanacetum coccineum]
MVGCVYLVISNNCKDMWKWSLVEDDEFTVKELSRMIEEKIIVSDSVGQEMLWNKLVPKKVKKFVWRALRRRLLVRVELDRRGINLDSKALYNVKVMETASQISCDDVRRLKRRRHEVLRRSQSSHSEESLRRFSV